MGMSPSCHCICPGTGEVYSSPTIETVTGCVRCTGGIGPRRYRLDISGATGPCSSFYNGSFLLINGGAPACNYLSAELGINLLLGGCTSFITTERFALIMQTLTGPTRYRFNLGINVNGTVCAGGSNLVSATVTDPNKLNCMLSHTLSVGTATEWAGFGGCGGARLVLPTSCTITPV